MDLTTRLQTAWQHRDQLSADTVPKALLDDLEAVLIGLETGKLRVCEKDAQGHWVVHTWLKEAILLYFQVHPNQTLPAGFAQFYDKVPVQFLDHTAEAFAAQKIRIVPPACVRRGAYLAPGTVVMPAFVNIGAYVGEGTMIDTWATVGSCAQIGARVHISGGTGIGGVLEPLQATPTIIEDDCFIGARSEIVEGVIVEAGSVISMGVFIGQSSRIYDREKDEVLYGRVPAGSVVVPGSLPSDNGKYQLQCAVIVKRVDAKTRAKVGLNALLREAIHD